MSKIIYVAINKKTGDVMSGAKGQYAFDNKSTLGRSVGQSYKYQAYKEGVKVKDMYDIKAIDVSKVQFVEEEK